MFGSTHRKTIEKICGICTADRKTKANTSWARPKERDQGMNENP